MPLVARAKDMITDIFARRYQEVLNYNLIATVKLGGGDRVTALVR